MDLCRPEKTLLVINKSDQAQTCDPEHLDSFTRRVAVSAKYGLGLDELRQAIADYLGQDPSLAGDEGIVIMERRHRDALLRAVKALETFLQSTGSSVPFEFLAMELREALAALGLVTGETTPDEILEQIFTRFCIGK
jgi:tRNA modification GTPase